MTRHVKLCLSLLLVLLLSFTVAIGVLADPDTPEESSSSEAESTPAAETSSESESSSAAESSSEDESSAESSEESSSPESSDVTPSGKRTVFIQGSHVQVYFNGSDTPAKQFPVDAGSSVAIRVVADEGYQIQSVTMNGLPIPGGAGNYAISRVDFDCVVVVETISDGTSSDDSSDDSSSGDSSDDSSEVTDPTENAVEVRVTIHGPGRVSVNGTVVESNGDTVTQSVWVQNTDLSGERVQFVLTPASGYRLTRLALDGNSNYELRTSFPSRITEETTVEVTFSEEAAVPSSFPVNISVSEGGYVSANGQEILAGSSATVDISAGGSMTIWINPSEEYELDALYVDNDAQNTIGGSYTLSNIGKETNVRVEFKKKTSVISPVQASDLAWTADAEGLIKLNFSANGFIGKSVFDKINTLSENDGDYVVLMTQYVQWYIPCGARFDGVTGDLHLSAAMGANAADYEKIKNALQNDGNPDNDIYTFYQISDELTFPAGTQVSFYMADLADPYGGGDIDLMVRAEEGGQWVLQAAAAGSIGADGWTSRMEYRNSIYQVATVRPVVTDVSDVTSSEPEPSSSVVESSVDEVKKSYAGLIVALVIAFVAVGGAAALFVVKWRQEKF